MSRTVYTFNRYHLGDCLIFLHLLRALAKAHVSTPFVHFCHACYIPQLQEAVMDLPNILLMPFESELWKLRQHEAIDTWKNCQRHWEDSPNRWNWSQHTLDHHAWTAKRMGFESPFSRREDLLFDYPALGVRNEYVPADFLIVNSEPSSGQFKPMAGHGSGYLNGLILALNQKHRVIVTEDFEGRPKNVAATRNAGPHNEGFTISQIGSCSRDYKNIIGVATGPMWPCINVHNNHSHEGRRFIALLDNQESLNLPHWEQVPNVEDVLRIAKSEGWI